ncbi:carbohydrate ABC transporter permease [uncultured Enterovirga sp.]|uniref:carbohydrate ABC transporter permease n=1 Tax=uncultured Enterovirga sp. TaxID=2026352 RepID=UPI0035CABBF4
MPVAVTSPRGESLLAYAFMAPAVLLIAGVTGYGTYSAFDYSLYEATIALKKRFVGLANFREMFADSSTRGNVWTTGIYLLAGVPATVALGLGLALLLDVRVRLAGLFRTLLIVPWITSLVITALLWRFVLNGDLGPLPRALESVGLSGIQFLDQTWAMPSLVLASAWNGYAFSMILLLASLQQIPESVGRAARVDGLSPWLVFRHILLPHLTPTLLIVTIVASMHYLNMIELPLILTGGGPGRQTEILPLRLYREAFDYYNTGYASAMSVVVFAFNCVLTVFYILAARRRAT